MIILLGCEIFAHGEMAYGSGSVAAHRYGAAEIVDPKPFARGSLIETFQRFPWVQRSLPAMGYSPAQLDDLAATIAAIDCDTIVIATPVDLARPIPLDKPYCRVRYDLEEISRPQSHGCGNRVSPHPHDQFEAPLSNGCR